MGWTWTTCTHLEDICKKFNSISQKIFYMKEQSLLSANLNMGEYTWPVQSQGSLKGTYSSSLLYIPIPDLLGLPSASFSNFIFAMLSNNFDKCLWTWGRRTKGSTKKYAVCLEMFTHRLSQHYGMCLRCVDQAYEKWSTLPSRVWCGVLQACKVSPEKSSINKRAEINEHEKPVYKDVCVTCWGFVPLDRMSSRSADEMK